MYRWVEHTGELELEIRSPSEEGVFVDALAAVAELLSDEDATDAVPAERRVDLRSADRPGLLAAWLAELAFLAETDGLVPARMTELELRDDGLIARVSGRLGSPPHLVKAVTYHRLAFDRDGDGWRARAVLDV